MYRIAVVQNQSEMAHYGYADAQHIMRDLGYEVQLYTAHNIEALSGSLSSMFDAVFLGSNSLNDKTIRRTLTATDVCQSVREFLADGGGLISMHQLGMAGATEAPFSFLPDERSRELFSIVRPLDEDPTFGGVSTPSGTASHILTRYPHLVTGEEIVKMPSHFAAYRASTGIGGKA